MMSSVTDNELEAVASDILEAAEHLSEPGETLCDRVYRALNDPPECGDAFQEAVISIGRELNYRDLVKLTQKLDLYISMPV